jgi:aryl-alcohol dehydrogenase-like predicted oxidoreductase
MSYGVPDRGTHALDARRGAEPAVHPAAPLEAGINFFDTANVY